MEQRAYLLFEREGLDGGALGERLRGRVSERLTRAGAREIAVSVSDEAVAAGAGVGIRRSSPPIAALVCFRIDPDADPAYEEELAAHAGRIAGYAVEESLALDAAPPAAADGRTPGVNMVACIRRRTGISRAEFLKRWLHEHRAVALETQATFRYARHSVLRTLTADAPAWDGIVEEGFPLEALTEPRVWYAAGDCDETLQRHRARMLESCRRFLDFETLETTPMSRYEAPG